MGVDAKIEREMELAYLETQHWVNPLIGNVVAGLIVILSWQVSASFSLLLWLAMLSVIYLLEMVFAAIFRTHPFLSGLTTGQKAVIALIFTAIEAVFWGPLAVWLALSDELVYQLVFTCHVVIMSSTIMTISSPYVLDAYAWLLFTMPAYLWLYFEQGTVFSYSIVALITIFVVSIVLSARASREKFIDMCKLQIELETQKTIAETANRAKTRFLAAASHDLRQPLHALSLFMGSLRSCPEDTLRLTEQMSNSVDSLERLLNSLLDISKLDAGLVKVSKADISLRDFVQSTAYNYRPLAEEKGLVFTVNAEDGVITADAALLETMLGNLISNAIRYTEKGEVIVTARRKAKQVLIEVSDTGIGMQPSDIESIFDEFYQLDNEARRSNEGLGLGLSIVKRLGDIQSIPISVETQPGIGSRFTLSLPAVAHTIPKAEAVLSPRESSLEGISVLVVDDNRDILNGMRELLSNWKMQVQLAETLSGAVAAVAVYVPDMVIVDYRLDEDITGLDVLAALEEEVASKLPAVIITGDISPDLLLDMSNKGYPVLHKPVKAARLRACLGSLL